MVEAMVSDAMTHLRSLQSKRDLLETKITENATDEVLLTTNSELAQTLKDYKSAAIHLKKHCAKPKAKAKAEAQAPALPAPVPEA